MYQKKIAFGVALIELILAISLSLLLITALFAIYLTAENNKNAQTALFTIQENAKIIQHILSHHLRMAGYIGCAKLTDDFPLTNHLAIPVSLENKIQHYENNEVKVGTDAITIWHASAYQVNLIDTMQDRSTLYIASGLTFSVGDAILITDCQTAEIAIVKRVLLLKNNIQRIIVNDSLHKMYGKNSDVAKFVIESFFVADTGRKDQNGHTVDAIYLRKYDGRKMELIEGVSNMKIKYFPQINGISLDLILKNVLGLPMQKNWSMFVALS